MTTRPVQARPKKLSYGNETDFAGLKLADITNLKLSVYATGEDDQAAATVISPGNIGREPSTG